MLPRLKFYMRSCCRVALLRWLTVGLCVASLVTNLMLYLANLAIPAGLLLLQLAATLAATLQLGLGARSISLRPAELAERMLKVQEDERQHLSRELHDDIGQLLTAAKLQLQWLKRRMPAELQGHCDALHSTLDDTLGTVRNVSSLLNPRQLASLGLEASLRAHLVRTLGSSSVHWSLACNQRQAAAAYTGAWRATNVWAALTMQWPWQGSASPRKQSPTCCAMPRHATWLCACNAPLPGWRCRFTTMAAASSPPGTRPRPASAAWPACRSG